jgi:NCAIR mutase (PurE)-related protein
MQTHSNLDDQMTRSPDGPIPMTRSPDHPMTPSPYDPISPYNGVSMNAQALRHLFEQVRKKRLSPDDAVERLRHLPFEDLGFAKLDHHRALRQGMPEVIFAEGKTPSQVADIFTRLAAHGGNVLATRATEEQYAAVVAALPRAECRPEYRPEYRPLPRAIVLKRDRKKHGKGVIVVVSAGTSDIPVAEEAVVTAELMGNNVQHIYDVGVAGIHRLLAHRGALAKARVIVVCAGMEGALPSVVGGLVGVPVIAVPTSVGYGAAFEGLAALLGMMNSCASNVSVVNIDNGFGAGYVASLINRL